MQIINYINFRAIKSNMQYSSIDSEYGKIIIRDGSGDELLGLTKVYKSVFQKHNVFQKEDSEVRDYLRTVEKIQSAVGGGFLIALLGNRLVGGVLLKRSSIDLLGKHTLWKFNHLAVAKDFHNIGVGKALVKSAEDKIKALIQSGEINSAKVEIGVSDNEKEAIDFYKKIGFELEGSLRNHYRYGETVHILGKEI